MSWPMLSRQRAFEVIMENFSKAVLHPRMGMSGYYALAYAHQLIGRGTVDFDNGAPFILIEEWDIKVSWNYLTHTLVVRHKGKRPTHFDPCKTDERNDMLIYIASLMSPVTPSNASNNG